MSIVIKKPFDLSTFILFSGGQDSSILVFFFLIQEKKYLKEFFFLHHSTQLNNFQILDYFNIFSLLYQQKYSFSFLKYYNEKFFNQNEENLRISRYQLICRIELFLNLYTFNTGHTKSDLTETFVLNLTRGIKEKIFHFNFEKRFLLERSYHRNLTIKKNKIFTNVSNKIRKKTKFTCNFSINQKVFQSFSRPLKYFSRKSIQKIFNKVPLSLVIDLTNFSFFITRNKVRRHLLLYIEIFLNKNFEHRLEELFLRKKKTNILNTQENTLIFSFRKNIGRFDLLFFEQQPLKFGKFFPILFLFSVFQYQKNQNYKLTFFIPRKINVHFLSHCILSFW